MLRTDAMPGGQFEGTINFIDPVLDPRTRTANVRLAIDNTQGNFRPGMFMQGQVETLIGDPNHPPIVIPTSAVLLTGRRAVVYVQIPGEKPTFEGREVVLGPRTDVGYVVLEGIDAGELVVTDGAFKIDSELQIKAKPSMMSRRDSTADMRLDVPSAFVDSLTPLYGAYFGSQRALAEGNFESFVNLAGDVAFAVELADSTGLQGKGRDAWNRFSHALAKASAKAAAASEIAEARVHFEDMSKAAIQMEYAFGHRGGLSYEMFCPMAFDFKGAAWLQRDELLANPYFGDEMLRCGTTESVFEPTDGAAR
jgi:Cu(I)/Ag(I) efflux system membrane fusion protein